MTLRALIADDEPLARERLRRLLEREADIEVVAECRSGGETATGIRALRPDLVFLDVQMPGGTGFEALAALGAEAQPAVVFVTAYDEHAVRAFEVSALDYLLKPVSRQRLRKALDRARSRAPASAVAPEWLLVKDGDRTRLLKAEEVDFVGAEGNYVRVHAAGRSHLVRETLVAMRARLDPRRFFRLHRAFLVNLSRVKELRPLFHGRSEVLLHDGTRLLLSRRRRRELEERLGARR
jgi:two-component system, LytTR family, response regulator